MGKRSKQKKQATLGFNPLPSSSARETDLPASVRDRAATVTYDTVPKRKKEKKRDAAAKVKEEDGRHEVSKNTSEAPPLPTPTTSSQPSQSTKSDRRKRKRQGKLDFGFHGTAEKPLSPPPTAQPADTQPPSSAKPDKKSGLFGKRRQVTLDESSSEDDMSKARGPLKRRRRDSSSSQESASDVPTKKRARKTERPTTRRSSKRAQAKPTVTISSEEEQSGDEDVTNAASTKPEFGDIAEPETSGDDVMRSSPAVKSRRTPAKKSNKNKKDDFVVDDDEIEGEESGESDVKPRRRLRQKVARDEEESGDEEREQSGSDEVQPVTPSRRIQKGKRDNEKDDLDEDLEFLRSSPPSIVRKTTPKVTAKQKALELLRRRRAGEKMDTVDEESENNDDESDQEGGSIQEDEPDAFEDVGEEEEDDFIIEDDDNVDLAELKQGIPLHLTAHGRMKLKDVFKIAIEWFVQKKINPAFPMEDELYRLAFQKLDDEVQGLSSSKFTSSVWRTKFTLALKARPRIVPVMLGDRFAIGNPGCDACGRQSHPASYQISFEGKPYHPETLESISDDDSDDEEDDVDRDIVGREIPKEHHTWNVGVHCKNNAEIAHTLHHWRYHLNEWVVDYLHKEGHLSQEKVFERDSWSTKKKRKYANKITDKMEETKQIKSLYNDFKANVENARNAKQYGGRWSR